MNKKCILISILIGVIIISLILVLIFYRDFDGSKPNIVEISVKSDDYLKEIITDSETGYLDYYENNEFIKTISIMSTKRKAMVLVNDVVPKDTLKYKKPIGILEYTNSLEESSMYIEFLKEKGYSVMREARTPDYIEIFMKYGSNIKRLIIFNDRLIIGDIDKDSELPDENIYFKDYKI